MKYTKLGDTGLDVSRICLGCMSYGDPQWQAWVLGEDEAVIATKVFFPTSRNKGPNTQGLSRKRIFDACDASLKRLGVDYIDLYQIHRFDPRTPLEETLEALHALAQAGKVRYLGASSMATWQFARALMMAEGMGWHRFATMQNHFNLIYREEKREMLPLCLEEGVGVIPWSPLARGFLGGKRTRQDRDPTLRAQIDQYGKMLYESDDDFDVLDAVLALAKKRGYHRRKLPWLGYWPHLA